MGIPIQKCLTGSDNEKYPSGIPPVTAGVERGGTVRSGFYFHEFEILNSEFGMPPTHPVDIAFQWMQRDLIAETRARNVPPFLNETSRIRL